jgi:hypothetical protein
VAITAPVPRPSPRFWRRESRWMAISRHPESSADPPRVRGESDSRFAAWLDAPPDGITRRRALRVRPPFTRPCPLFLERVCRAYSRPDVAYRLLQLHFRRASNQTRVLDPRRDGGLDLLPCLTRHASPLRKRCHAASRATFTRFDPGAGSSCLRRFARPRYRLGCPTSEFWPRV